MTKEILASAVIAAIVSGIVALINKGIDGKRQYVTSERQRWRDEIRKITTRIYYLFLKLDDETSAEERKRIKTKINTLKHKLAVWLNPNDNEDIEILKAIDTENKKSFQQSVQHLLKHDWERVKLETGSVHLHYSLLTLVVTTILYFLCRPSFGDSIKIDLVWQIFIAKSLSVMWIAWFLILLFCVISSALSGEGHDKILRAIFLYTKRSGINPEEQASDQSASDNAQK